MWIASRCTTWRAAPLRWRLKQGVEALTVPGAAAVLLGNAGELALYPLE
jgi:hypothetical protein